jgi:hypothetical protein
VLVVGGYTSGYGASEKTEFYDSSTGTFAYGPNPWMIN